MYYNYKIETLAKYLYQFSTNILLQFQSCKCDTSRENPNNPNKFDGFYDETDNSYPKILSPEGYCVFFFQCLHRILGNSGGQ